MLFPSSSHRSVSDARSPSQPKEGEAQGEEFPWRGLLSLNAGAWSEGIARFPVAFPAASIALMVTILLLSLMVLDYRQAQSSARQTSQVLTQSLLEHANWVVGEADRQLVRRGLLALQPSVSDGGRQQGREASPPPVSNLLPQELSASTLSSFSPGPAALPHLRGVVVFGPTGEVANNDNQVPPALMALLREQMLTLMARSARDGDAYRDYAGTALRFGPLRVSQPSGRGGDEAQNVLLLWRLVFSTHGQFHGAVVAALDTDSFAAFYRALSLGGQSLLMLMRTDGRTLLRVPYLRNTAGGDLRSGPDLSYLPIFGEGAGEALTSPSEGRLLRDDRPTTDDGQSAVAEAPVFGLFFEDGRLDGVPRQFAYAKLHDVPLMVAVGLSEDHILSDWRRHSVALLAVGGAVVILSYGLLSVLDVQKQQQLSAGREAERRAAHLVRSQTLAQVGSWEWDLQENRLWLSPGLLHLYGLSSASPSYEDILAVLHPQDRRRVVPVIARALGDGQSFSMDYRVCLADGSLRYLRHEGQCVLAADGSVARMDCVVADLTQTSVQQTQMLQAGKLSTLGEMAAGMVHELSQPLNILRMAAELALLDLEAAEAGAEDGAEGRSVGGAPAVEPGPLHAAWRQTLERVTSQADRMGQTLDQIRLFSQSDSGPVQVFDMVESVQKAARMIEPTLDALKIGFQVQLPTDGQPLLVKGLAVQLEQVLLSFLVNAKDAVEACYSSVSPDSGGVSLGQVSVSVTAFPQEVRVRVEDNGQGIPPSVMGRVFEPFFTTKPIGQGSGLGLSVSYGIVKAMGGSITALNRTEGGARFDIYLPLSLLEGSTAPSFGGEAEARRLVEGEAMLPAVSEAASAAGWDEPVVPHLSDDPPAFLPESAPEPPSSEGRGATVLRRKSRHVLIVEAQPGALVGMEEHLDLLGQRVSRVASIDEAYCLFVADQAQLLVVDGALSAVQQQTLVQYLREISPELPLLLVVPEGSEGDERLALSRLPLCSFARLPLSLPQLAQMLERPSLSGDAA